MNALRVALVCVALAGSLTVRAQVKQYDWYPAFRSWLQSSVPREQRSPEVVAQRYSEKLKAEGGDDDEIRRRITLLLNNRQDLENDFWNPQ